MKILFKLLSLSLILTLMSLPIQNTFALEETFTDVSQDSQFYTSIQFLAEKGIIEGYEEGTFEPREDVNRAEAAKIMVLANGADPDPQVYKNCFLDVQEQWFARFVCYGKDQGWLSGHPDGNFLPADSVNHAELTKMALNSLFDHNEVTEGDQWYTPYLDFAGQKNIIWKYDSEKWPGSSASRDEVAEQFFRAMLVEQGGWPAYSDYFRDIYFQEINLTHLIEEGYPCYYNSHFGFFPAFPEYLESEYGITKLDGMIYNFTDLPHFDGVQFCVSNQGNLVFSGITSDQNGDEYTMRQHLFYFDPEGNLIKDMWVPCENWKNLDRPSLLIDEMDLDNVELLHCFYAKDEKSVYYRSDHIFGPDGPTGPEVMDDADPVTFELLTFPYARDKDRLYAYWSEVEGVDLASFETITSPGVSKNAPFTYYGKDKDHVYYYGKVLPEADPETFERLSFEGLELDYPAKARSVNYSKDENHVFFGREILKEADLETFHILDMEYSVDTNNVYRYGEKVEDWDGGSFEIIDDKFMRDANHVYYQEYSAQEDESDFKTVEGADPKTFELLGEISEDTVFYRDLNHVYFFNFISYDRVDTLMPFEGVDPATFEILNTDYIRDKDHIYELGYKNNPEPVEDFDLGTFEALNNYYVRDKNGVYFRGEQIESADLGTFEVIGDGLAKDQFTVYRYGYSYVDIDPATFQKLEGENPNCIYKDKNHLYFDEVMLIPSSTLDVATAELIDATVVQDANGIKCTINTDDLDLTVCIQN